MLSEYLMVVDHFEEFVSHDDFVSGEEVRSFYFAWGCDESVDL